MKPGCRHWRDAAHPLIGNCAIGNAAGKPIPRPPLAYCRLCKFWDGDGQSEFRRQFEAEAKERAARQRQITANQPLPTITQMASAVSAMLEQGTVDRSVIDARLATCAGCTHRRVNTSGQDWCGLCGCRLSHNATALLNMARYEEKTVNGVVVVGCKHPQRSHGKGWQSLFWNGVVVVGNGPSMTGSELGSTIDGFGCVVRLNKYVIAGHEPDVGTKTTLWADYGRGTQPSTKPDGLLMMHDRAGQPALVDLPIWRVPREFYNTIRARVQRCSHRPEPAGLLPSGGLIVVAWLLEVCGVPQVAIAGIDHFRKQADHRHHYWDSRGAKSPGEHDGEAEAVLFGEYQAAGRLTSLHRLGEREHEQTPLSAL